MQELILTRTKGGPSSPDGTFGRLAVAPLLTLFTVEEDWLGNRRSISCIPAGAYVLRRTIYLKHGYETFEVTKVAGRTRILIHPANTEEDLEGCIGVGTRPGPIWVPKDEDTGAVNVMKNGVVNSREAFRQFMAAMAHTDEALLRIEWAPGVLPAETPIV